MRNTDPYPEHAKLSAISDESQAIGQFLEDGPYLLAEYCEIEGFRDLQLVPAQKPIQQVLAEYFDIDLARIEAEKRRMLEQIREENSR